jgi:seryl-tRNA synthetase
MATHCIVAGPASDELSVSTIDVAGLEPEEAIAKLLAQNNALTSHIGRLRNVTEDNKTLRDDNESLASRCKQLEAELKKQREILQFTKAHDR